MAQKKKHVIRRFISIPFRSAEELKLLDIAADADEKTLGEFLRSAMYDRIKTLKSPGLRALAKNVLARARSASKGEE